MLALCFAFILFAKKSSINSVALFANLNCEKSVDNGEFAPGAWKEGAKESMLVRAGYEFESLKSSAVLTEPGHKGKIVKFTVPMTG